MWTDFGHLWPLPGPILWTILLSKTYVVIWTFGKPSSPCHVHMVLWMTPKIYLDNLHSMGLTEYKTTLKLSDLRLQRYVLMIIMKVVLLNIIRTSDYQMLEFKYISVGLQISDWKVSVLRCLMSLCKKI